MKHILIINGSLRKQSFNGQLADYLADTYHHEADFTCLSYTDVPFFNEDFENPLPESIVRIRNLVSNADGVIIASPEYNGSIPGILKNLIDWLSRPLIYKDYSSGTVLKNKPVTIVSAAGSSKGINARSSLKQLLERLSMNVIHEYGTGIGLDRAAFTTNHLSISEEKKEKLKLQMEEFLSVI